VVYRIVQRRKQTAANDPLKACIEASLNEVNHEIWLQRTVFWWCWLPFTSAFAVSFCYASLRFHTPRFLAFLVLFVIPLAWWGYRLSRFTLRKVFRAAPSGTANAARQSDSEMTALSRHTHQTAGLCYRHIGTSVISDVEKLSHAFPARHPVPAVWIGQCAAGTSETHQYRLRILECRGLRDFPREDRAFRPTLSRVWPSVRELVLMKRKPTQRCSPVFAFQFAFVLMMLIAYLG